MRFALGPDTDRLTLALLAALLCTKSVDHFSAFKPRPTLQRRHLGVKPPAATAHMAVRRYATERRRAQAA